MKKFFTHNGSEHQGPFDIEELKNRKISKDTMVWFEGLDTWTKAGNIPELKEIISMSPPPFIQPTEVPPPLPKPEAPRNPVPLPLQKKKTSVWKTVRTLVIIVLVTIGAIVVLNILNNPSSNSFMEVKINPPSPRVVEQHAGEDPSSDILDFKEAVYATVINQGGEGRILVTAHLEQDGGSYQRSEEIFMRENETHDFHFTFNEVKMLGGKMTYYVEAKSIE